MDHSSMAMLGLLEGNPNRIAEKKQIFTTSEFLHWIIFRFLHLFGHAILTIKGTNPSIHPSVQYEYNGIALPDIKKMKNKETSEGLNKKKQ